jgi:uncharacterized protein (DUF2147 family)
MKRFILSIAAAAAALGASASANPKRSVIVNVERCGEAYCGTVSWASKKNRAKGAEPGTRVLSDLRHQGAGVYKGRAYEPKREIRGSATVRQLGPNTMVVKGCAIAGLFCKEQRWTRIS